MRFLLFALAMILIAGAGFGLTEQKPDGAVVLTVAGAVEKSNRGALEKERDTLFAYQNITFDRAYQFDHEMLGDLDQAQALVQPPQRRKPSRFSGPKLSALIEKVGAGAHGLRFVGLDGFATEMTPDEIAGQEWIVVTHEDGRPLEIGQQGPVWLMHAPADGVKPAKEEEQRWPWAVFYIEALGSP
jgi:hypothetical protein